MIECYDDVRTAGGLCLLDGDGNELGVSSRKNKVQARIHVSKVRPTLREKPNPC